MRVCHVFKATGLSGAEAHIVALSQAMRAEAIECELIVLADPKRPPAAVVQAAEAAGLRCSTEPLGGHLDFSAVPRLARQLRSRAAQLVHTHMIHGDLYGTLAAGWAGLQVVQSRHNHDRFRRLWPLSWGLRLLAEPAKTVIAISDSLADFTRDVEGVPGPKIKRIYYGLDPNNVPAGSADGLRSELGLAADTPVALMAGRLTEQKGARYLLQAWEQVRAALPGACLVVAGDGPQRARLEAQAAAAGQAVRFLGWRRDVTALMAGADVLVVPSLWEGFGLVTLEAMALRKPIVASRVGALPEIVVNGETGLLAPAAQPAALAGALVNVLSDPALAQAMGERGRRRLEKEFSVRRMAREHATVYREAASRVPEFRA